MNIKAIAKLSGYSVATVSRVINQSPKVSETARKKILAVMEEVQYTPNVFAQGLGLNSMNMVGILCSDVANPFYGLAVSLIENSLRRKGYDSLLCCSGTLPEDKKKCMALLLKKRVDAIVLIGSVFREEQDNDYLFKAAKTLPVFLINALLEGDNLYCVYCNERDAMMNAVCRLYHAGCRKILYLNDTASWSWAGMEKLKGYQIGLEKCGIAYRKELVQTSKNSIEDAKKQIEQQLMAGSSFDAVLVSEDSLAIGALKALQERGLRLPLIGFNNSILAACTTPTISSIDHNLDRLCPLAVDLLIQRLHHKQIPAVTVLPARLVERETFPLSISQLPC